MQTQTPVLNIKSDLPSINMYVKREDLLPEYFGGNKVRIAYEFFADMENQQKNCIVGYGNARSNLCRVLSNMSYVKGVPCHIISPADENGTRTETNNSSIVKLCGAVFHECTKQNVSETVEKVLNECKSQGLNPYYIYGDKYGIGNEATPVRAYAKVYSEIKSQSEEIEVKFDYIFFATGTGMTHAGLIAGQKIFGGNEKIVGISVARKKEQEIEVIKKYLNAYSQEQNFEYEDKDIIRADEYICGGYGEYDKDIENTIKDILKQNSIPLDPTYTGKAFCGMKKYIKENKIENANVLFIHTGGTPLFFDNINKIK